MDPRGAGGPAFRARRKRMAHRVCLTWVPCGSTRSTCPRRVCTLRRCTRSVTCSASVRSGTASATCRIHPPLLLSRRPDTHFSGELAIAAFNRAGGASYRGAKVPVENDTARYPGAEDSHWRESVFGDELMTGGVRGVRGTFEPLSRVTVASLADLGYAVNYAAADAFRLPRPGSALRDPAHRATLHFAGDTFPEPPTVVELPEHVVRVLNRD